MMEGEVFSVNISKVKGVRKSPVSYIRLKKNVGVISDAHSKTEREVSLLDYETILKHNCAPGDFAENITTKNIDFSKLKISDKLKIGDDAIIQLFQKGKTCHTLCEIGQKLGKCIMPEQGWFAKVIKSGIVKPGSKIKVLKPTVAIITLSESCYKNLREDESGKYIVDFFKTREFDIKDYKIIPDNKKKLKSLLLSYCKQRTSVVLTTGSTGIGKTDIAPDVTKKIIEKELTGIGELIRTKGYINTPYSYLSRATAGIKKETLIVNLPGSLVAVKDSLETIYPLIIHCMEVIYGKPH